MNSNGSRKVSCLAPWVHSHLTAEGSRSLCAIHKSRKKADAFSDWWNSEYLRDVRRKFMAGETIDGCEQCFSEYQRSEGDEYYKVFERDYGKDVEIILSSTDADGFTSYKPKHLDYRSDLCNLRCRTCGPLQSTSIRNELKELKDLIPVREVISSDDTFEEILALIGNVDALYWAGGEPLVNPVYWQIMDYLVDNNMSNIKITHNTNAMVRSKDWLRLIEYAQFFKSFDVYASVDAFYRDGEYIRSGYKHSEFINNIEAYIVKRNGSKLSLDITLTSLGLLTLKDICEFCLEHDLQTICKGMDVLYYNCYLDINTVSLGLIENVSASIYQLNDPKKLLKPVKDVLRKITDQYNPMSIEKSKDALNYFERRRGEEGYLLERLSEYFY